jgi:hypothetical protein
LDHSVERPFLRPGADGLVGGLGDGGGVAGVGHDMKSTACDAPHSSIP